LLKKLIRWYKTKKAKDAVNGVLLAALIISVLGNLGLWHGVGDLLSGTIVGQGDYSCFPSCDVDDGKFLAMPEMCRQLAFGQWYGKFHVMVLLIRTFRIDRRKEDFCENRCVGLAARYFLSVWASFSEISAKTRVTGESACRSWIQTPLSPHLTTF